MRIKHFLPLLAGLIVFTAAAWADASQRSLADVLNLQNGSGTQDATAAAVPNPIPPTPIPPTALYNESFTHGSFDAVPLIDLSAQPTKEPVQVKLVVAEIVVGFNSVNAVGLMVGW